VSKLILISKGNLSFKAQENMKQLIKNQNVNVFFLRGSEEGKFVLILAELTFPYKSTTLELCVSLQRNIHLIQQALM
jgi:hypothetical protein